MPKKIVLIPDVPGWAWDRRARGIQKYAGADYNVQVVYERDAKAWLKMNSWDGCLWFGWYSSSGGRMKMWTQCAAEGCLHNYRRPPSACYPERLASRSYTTWTL